MPEAQSALLQGWRFLQRRMVCTLDHKTLSKATHHHIPRGFDVRAIHGSKPINADARRALQMELGAKRQGGQSIQP